ncbi:PKD domain-containing protein [Bacillus sp. 3255]|uniref:PKD domain-containing protein n=1 Tax=Bacillus sp. 3255 TaxID=2817904 RepID=UPI0028575BA6|nr:PKD domain-containing protein [Bacillus sp. 3255]MDR6878883.1 hypothetical protein [Bacillus sp. 3255]
MILIEILIPLFNADRSQAASTVRLYYNFEQGTYSSLSVLPQYSSAQAKSFSKDISDLISGNITGVTINNQTESNGIVTFTSTSVTVNNLNGAKTKVYGKSETNPMHQIYRQPLGKIWEHKGSKTVAVEFDGVKGNPSPYPGSIPKNGRLRYLTTLFNYNNVNTYGPDLRYTYLSPLYSSKGASGDQVTNYDKEGYAVTTAYEVPKAMKWFLQESSTSLSGTDADITDPDKLDQSSIQIIKAEKYSPDYGAEPLAFGKGDTPGTGMIRTMMLLDGSVPPDQIRDFPDPDGSGGLLRNYAMYAIGLWSGTTYKYQMSIDVTYSPPNKADLAALSIEPDPCVQTGISTDLKITFKNIGINIPRGTRFTVTVAADGAIIKTLIYTAGLNNNVPLTEIIPYTFNTVKSITLTVDANDDIPETSASNNTITTIITPQTSCGPTGGGYIGKTSADRPAITWKESNRIKADWKIPSTGCTPVRGRFILSQATGASVQYGWSRLTSTATSDMSLFAYGMMGFTGYPGNITSGEVHIEYKLEDSCGGTSYFYEGKFTIGSRPPNRPPQFEIGWYSENDYTSRTPIAEAVVGDKLNARLLPEIAPNHYDPDDDTVTFEWLFQNSSSSWIKSFPALGYLKGEEKLTWLTATSAGRHTISARMCDDKGACTEEEATIDIMRPEPIPCINIPNRVVQHRPLPANAINGACSKAALGRTIVQEFWTNKRSVYPTIGVETVSLEVMDNRGVRSLPANKAIKHINVVEDKPPAAVINLPLFAVRGNIPFRDMSYSPDGDVIVETKISYVYDKNNDGIFNDHMPLEISISVGGSASLTAMQVGKYQLTVTAKEDWGLTDTRTFDVDIKNDSPEASFTVTSSNPEPPKFDTILENEMLMAFGDQWQGSSLTNPSLNKAKDIGFTYNTATNGLTSHYGKQPYYGPAIGLTITPEQYERSAYTAWHSFPVPSLFNTQFLGNRYGVGSIGAIPLFNGKTTSMEGGLGTVKPTPDNPGKYLAYDTKGGAYSIDLVTSRYDDNYSESWTLYRKLADGTVSWSRSGSYTYDGCSGDCDPTETGTRAPLSILKLNDDGTKVMVENTYSYLCWCQKSTWVDVETGLEVPAASIIPAPSFTGIYEDSEVYMYREQSKVLTTDTYSSGSWGSSANRLGKVSEYLVSVNKSTGAVRKLAIFKDIAYKNTYRIDDGSIIRGDGEDTSNDTFVDAHYSVSADGYVYVVDGFNRIVVTDKFANQLASFPTKSLRPTNSTINHQTLNEIYKYTIAQAGLSADGEFQVVLQEDHYKLRRWNFKWKSCGACSVGSYVSSYDSDDSASERKFYYYKIKGSTANSAGYASSEIGQTLKKDANVKDADYVFDFLQSSANMNENAPSGLIFRATSHNTMYRLEMTTNKISIAKIEGGVRTELKSTSVWLPATSFTNMKVSVRGGNIKVRLGTVPILELNDSTLGEGTYGFFIGGYGSHFRNFYVKIPLIDNTVISDTGIAGEQLTYQTDFYDPENDEHLVSRDKWTYEHSNASKFLDAGDGKSGLSALHQQSYIGSPQRVLDKVGIYTIAYIGADDPTPVAYKYPNPTFAPYISESEPYFRNVLVHRRPVGVLRVSQDPYYRISYDDQSYDPDRWLSGSTFSTEPTGIDYSTTRGITERRYEYIKPDGSTMGGKLNRATEMGMYTFRVAVKDEYGAWSDWAEDRLWLNAPPENHAPFVEITSHKSTDMNAPSGAAALNPVFTWNAVDYDAKSRIVASELDVQYYRFDAYSNPPYKWISQRSPNLVRTHDESSDGQVVSFSYAYPLEVQSNKTYKIRIRVQDEHGEWSAWDEKYFARGFPPSATLTFPNGTQANPTLVTSGVLSPSWNQNDPDIPTAYSRYEYRILDAAGRQVTYQSRGFTYTAFVSGRYARGCSLDSESSVWYRCSYGTAANSWTAQPSEQFGLSLLAGRTDTLQVQVRVNDGTYWSDWSNSGWFMMNRPPAAEMTIPAGSQEAPTIFSELRPTFQWNQTDSDPGTIFKYFQLQITNESNDVVVADSGQHDQGSASSVGSWQVTQDLPAGQKLRVRVRVHDGAAWSDYSPQTWFYINRAPVAEFDWTPKPVWEGDVVHSINASYDLDGDQLSYLWEIVRANGSALTFSTPNVAHHFLAPGVYKVTLTVSDGRAAHSVAKLIAAMPLTIRSDVTYTDNWLLFHEKSGHQTSAAPKDFYSGEILVVSAQSSPAPVEDVTAWIETIGMDGKPLYATVKLTGLAGDPTLFTGELFDAKFQSLTEGLPLGLQIVRFQIRYRNGVVKQDEVPINIIGNVNKAVGVHRVH